MPARFVDVTSGAGLVYPPDARREGDACLLNAKRLQREFPEAPFAFNASYAKTQCVPERMTGGAAVGDYDADGWPDVYITRLDGPGLLFRNQRNSTFRDVTGEVGLSALTEPSSGAAFGDLDNDGHADLFVTTLAGHRSYLFHNNGNGTFTEDAIARGAAQSDGLVHTGYSVNLGDYDNDGFLDIHTSEWRLPEHAPNNRASHNRLLRNLGSSRPGHFEDVTATAGVGLETNGFGVVGFASSLTDLDDDGVVDLIAVNDFSTGRLFWGNEDGTFTDGTRASGFATEENGMGLALADYDADGDVDVFVSSIYDKVQCPVGQCVHGTSGNRLYRNDGDRHFTDVTDAAGVRDGGWGWGAAWIDAVNQGRPDLLMASGVDFPWEPTSFQYKSGPMYFWRSIDGQVFTRDVADESGLSSAQPGKGLVTLDFDRDGRRDVLVVRDGAPATLWHNASPNVGASIGVHLVGTTSNRDAIGAIVRVRSKPSGPTITHRYGSGTEFLGHSELVATIGLGVYAQTVDIEIEWPSGARTVRNDVPVGRYLTITEGEA